MEILEVVREVLNQMVDKELPITDGSVVATYLKSPYVLIMLFNIPLRDGVHDNVEITVLYGTLETGTITYMKPLKNIARAEVEVARGVARIKSYKLNI